MYLVFAKIVRDGYIKALPNLKTGISFPNPRSYQDNCLPHLNMHLAGTPLTKNRYTLLTLEQKMSDTEPRQHAGWQLNSRVRRVGAHGCRPPF